MIRRWCIYLAALLVGIGLFMAVSAWVTWVLLLTIASLPLFSVLVRKRGCEYDRLGLFRFPVGKGTAEYDQVLRPYQPGDSLNKVHWKLTAKTGVLTVREVRAVVLPNAQRQRWWGIATVGLCLGIIFCLFPPWKYGRQMQFLQTLLLRPYGQEREAYVDLTAGPVAENRQAVLDVVASQSQTLYLRGQAFDIYDGKSWRVSDAGDGFWPAWGLEDAGTVTVATRAVQKYRYFPYYTAGEEYNFVRGALKNEECLREYTYRQRRSVGAVQTGEIPEQYLQLPEETRTWSEGVLLELFGKKSLGETEKIEKIQNFVRSCASYDKNAAPMPGEEADFARWFLESGRGYCVHFATTAVVLLRSAGVPARLATGYTVAVQAGVRKTVVGSDAHAWVEYLCGGIWRILEPTPSLEAVPPMEMPIKTETAEKSGRYFDVLWGMIGMMLIVMLALVRQKLRSRWDGAFLLCRLLGEDVAELKKLAQKSAYSRNGLTPNEREILKNRQIAAKRALRKKLWFLR